MGTYRSQPDLQKQSKEAKGNGLTCAVSSMCGWRTYNQDAYIVEAKLDNTENSLFAVFDGHGGADVSTFAAKFFVEQLEKNKNYKEQNYKQALENTFVKIDQLLASQSGKQKIKKIQQEMIKKQNGPKQQIHKSGCTANVILITPKTIYCANAGDSRSVASIRGQTKALSYDHKPQIQKQLKRIKSAGGSVSYGRVNGVLNLSRALGDLQYKNPQLQPQNHIISAFPDVQSIQRQGIDFIIMGCDGIWEAKINIEMIDWISERIDNKIGSKAILQELLDSQISKEGGSLYGTDNMTAILIQFDKK